jgi:hypothetical protein
MDTHDSDNRLPRSRRLDDLRGADGQAITAHGYPAAADTSKINYPMTILLLSGLVVGFFFLPETKDVDITKY